MKIVSWNVNGIRAVAKKGFAEIIKSLDPDILCLQETKATAEQVKEAVSELTDYEVIANEAERKGYSGTAILSRKSLVDSRLDMGIEQHDSEGRLIMAEFEDFILVNSYVPNSGNGLKRLDYRQDWDADLRNYLAELDREKPVIFCGDLNVAHRDIDIARPKSNYNKTAGFTQQEIDGLDALLEKGFVDSFRELYPDEVKYSWWSYRMGARAKNIGWRLDYFIVSKKIWDRVSMAEIHTDVMGSDHCPVSLTLK
jgi:exodeoxyribonuclease-3